MVRWLWSYWEIYYLALICRFYFARLNSFFFWSPCAVVTLQDTSLLWTTGIMYSCMTGFVCMTSTYLLTFITCILYPRKKGSHSVIMSMNSFVGMYDDRHILKLSGYLTSNTVWPLKDEMTSHKVRYSLLSVLYYS